MPTIKDKAAAQQYNAIYTHLSLDNKLINYYNFNDLLKKIKNKYKWFVNFYVDDFWCAVDTHFFDVNEDINFFKRLSDFFDDIALETGERYTSRFYRDIYIKSLKHKVIKPYSLRSRIPDSKSDSVPLKAFRYYRNYTRYKR